MSNPVSNNTLPLPSSFQTSSSDSTTLGACPSLNTLSQRIQEGFWKHHEVCILAGFALAITAMCVLPPFVGIIAGIAACVILIAFRVMGMLSSLEQLEKEVDTVRELLPTIANASDAPTAPQPVALPIPLPVNSTKDYAKETDAFLEQKCQQGLNASIKFSDGHALSLTPQNLQKIKQELALLIMDDNIVSRDIPKAEAQAIESLSTLLSTLTASEHQIQVEYKDSTVHFTII